MSPKKPSLLSEQIVNLRAQDHMSDLGKAINVFTPKNIENPFLKPLEQGQTPQAQVQVTQPAEPKK